MSTNPGLLNTLRGCAYAVAAGPGPPGTSCCGWQSPAQVKPAHLGGKEGQNAAASSHIHHHLALEVGSILQNRSIVCSCAHIVLHGRRSAALQAPQSWRSTVSSWLLRSQPWGACLSRAVWPCVSLMLQPPRRVHPAACLAARMTPRQVSIPSARRLAYASHRNERQPQSRDH